MKLRERAEEQRKRKLEAERAEKERQFIEGTPQVHTFDVITSTIQKHELVTA